MDAESRARDIKLIVLDVDGVMTDGGLYFDEKGSVSKRFNAQDGLGIKFAQSAGLRVAVITGLASGAVEARIKALKIEDYYQGTTEKTAALDAIRIRHGFEWSEIAYVGDDWVDFGPLRMVGFPVAVQNAQPEVKELARYITVARGGEGAVREVVMFILQQQGKYQELYDHWMATS